MNKTLRWIALLATLAAVISACSHAIESPVPTGSTAEPDLVCNGKPESLPFTTVQIHGQNFTPMPTMTLDNMKQLVLPRIQVERTMELPGMGAEVGPSPWIVKDNPAMPADAANRVHWSSEQLMSFDIMPEDKFPIGVFSIRVTSPDSLFDKDKNPVPPPNPKHETVIEKGLAVIPPPFISELRPPAICDDQADQMVTINGSYFLAYDGAVPSVMVDTKTYVPVIDEASCTLLDGHFTEMNVRLCSSMTITIKQNDFPVTTPMQVKVVVTNPKPADCSSSNDIFLTINPPPRVDTVVPSTVCEGGSSITINGEFFLEGAKVTLKCPSGAMTPMEVPATNVVVSPDGKQITCFVPTAEANVTCDVVVTNPDGCQDRAPHQTVKGTSGPVLYYVDPPVVYNGINTRVTLFVTSINAVMKNPTVTMMPTGMMMPVYTLTVNYPVLNHPNRIEAIIPIGPPQDPQGPPAGVYDIHVSDDTSCPSKLEKAVTITDTLSVTLESVNPPFGWTNEDTAVTIFRDTAAPAPADKPFVATPRVFLNPTNPPDPMAVGVPLENVSFIDVNTATGVVPKGTPVHHYDVVLVNPDGSVGLLKDGYQEVMNPPPTVLTATPSSIPKSSGQVVTLSGSNFDQADVVTLICMNALGMPVASPNVVSMAPSPMGCTTNCTQQITIDGSTLAVGDVCVVRVTNPDGTYGEYSAIGITTPALNLNSPHVGTDMNVGRRALAAASGNATPAARFVYALGGDDGAMAPMAFATTEFASVDLFGKMGAWVPQTFTLNAPRTLAGSVTVGRYIYLVGGDNGMGPVETAERALILSPRETPVIADADVDLVKVPMPAGLPPGEYHYRVSAIFDPKDTDNPDGESLASDPFTIRLPPNMFLGREIHIILSWSAPVDALKMPVPGVVGYRIYRSAKADDPPGSEVLYKTVMGAATLSFTDDGTGTPGTEKPLPTGSTGKWAQLPNMGTKRSGVGVAAGNDPATPGTFYVYALLGKSNAATAVNTYEYLKVTTAPNGRQTAGAAWTAGAMQAAVARWQLGTWTATNITSTIITPPDTFIYLGGGALGGAGFSGVVEAGKVSAGGDLGAFSSLKPFGANEAGYGVCAANNQLFVFGGQGGAPSGGAKSAHLAAPPPSLDPNSWNNEGLNMTHGRYLMGSSVQSAFIFLLGGQTDEPSAASKTTELVIW